jgi:RHS repeat-associated protein
MLNRSQPDPQALDAMVRASAFLRQNYIGPGVRPGQLAIWSEPLAEQPKSRQHDAELGATGLGLVALAEARHAEPKAVPLEDLEALGRFLLFLQKDDGSFVNKYRAESGPVQDWESLYYPGEAALAFVSLYEADHSREWLMAAGKALSFLAKNRAGRSIVPADHWALIATAKLIPYCDQSSCPGASREELIQHAIQVCNSILREQFRGSAAVGIAGAFDPDGRTAPAAARLEGLLAALEFLPKTGCPILPPAITGATNLLGRRSSMCDASGATSWSYDTLGRSLTEKRTIQGTTAITNAVSYTYNFDGSLATLTYPSGRMITYTPSGAGRMLSAVDVANGVTYLTAATYTPHGAITGAVNGAASGFTGITVSNAYNKRLQPVLISAAAPSATVVSFSFDFHLGAGDNGDVFQIVNNRDNNRTQNFEYDALNRISQAYTSGSSPLTSSWGEVYTIDPWGNLTNRAAVAGKTNTELLNLGPATTMNQLAGFTYDAAGNLTQNGTGTYNYDAENRLIATAGWSYVYDGAGQRVRKSNSGSNGTLYWLGSGSNVLLETSMNGTPTEEYVFFGGKRIARRDVSTGAVHYYFSDHVGSASVITTSTGAIQKEADYYPYGGELPVSGSDSNNYKFTGKERDSESGLDNFGARYDSSAIARFMSPDAKLMSSRHLAFPQKWNKYAYVQNNPLLRVDPDGLDDYVIVRPATTTSNANWDAARAAVLKNPANTFTMLTGEKATVEAWQKATTTPGTHAIFVGHTSHEENPNGSIGKTSAVVLNDGRSSGQQGSEKYTVTPGPHPGDPPSVSGGPSSPGPETKADTVAIFGCQSSGLSGQYGGAANFVGMDSGKDSLSSLGALDAAGAAFVTGQANGQDAVGQANTAFQQNAVVNDVVNDKDGDHVEKTKDENVKND